MAELAVVRRPFPCFVSELGRGFAHKSLTLPSSIYILLPPEYPNYLHIFWRTRGDLGQISGSPIQWMQEECPATVFIDILLRIEWGSSSRSLDIFEKNFSSFSKWRISNEPQQPVKNIIIESYSLSIYWAFIFFIYIEVNTLLEHEKNFNVEPEPEDLIIEDSIDTRNNSLSNQILRSSRAIPPNST